MKWGYDKFSFRRIYFSAFEPIPKTDLGSKSSTPPWREHRLYQTDWLLRVYGFDFREITSVLEDDFLLN